MNSNMYTVKQTLLFMVVLFLFAPTMSMAQDYQFERNEVDKFTGDTIKETEIQPFAIKAIKALRFRIKKVNSQVYIMLRLTEPQLFSIHKDDNAYLLLANGTSVKLPAINYTISDLRSVSGLTYYVNDAYYEVSDENLELLKQSSVSSIRIDLSDAYEAFEPISKRKAERFQEMVKMF